MRYVYTTNLDDFKAAQRLLQRQRPGTRKAFLFWHRFMPLLGMTALVLLVRDIAFRHFSYPAWGAALLGGVAYLGLCPMLYRPFQIRKLYQAMKNGRLDAEPLELEIVGAELISRVPGRSEGRFQRASIRDRYEDAQTLALFINDKSFLLLPHRTLPESAFTEVRSWLGGADVGTPASPEAAP